LLVFFCFFGTKKSSGNCCPSTTKVQLKVNVEDMYCRKKKIAINVRELLQLGN